jgi:hypothetical protein
MKSFLTSVFSFIFFSVILINAQNISVAQADVYGICWDQDAPDLTTAQSYTYQASIDNTPFVNIAPVCSGVITPFKCQAPPPLSKTKGSHKFTITANVILIDGTLISSTISAQGTYNTVGQPSTPTNPRISK